jgi:ABC-type nickel/cobalt efflux system permease component RcnA
LGALILQTLHTAIMLQQHNSSILFSPFSAALLVAVLCYFVWKALRPTRKLKNVPTIGYDGTKESLEAAKKRFITDAAGVLMEGYQQASSGC